MISNGKSKQQLALTICCCPQSLLLGCRPSTEDSFSFQNFSSLSEALLLQLLRSLLLQLQMLLENRELLLPLLLLLLQLAPFSLLPPLL